MNEKSLLQNRQRELQKDMARIASVRKMAEMKLQNVKARLCAATNSRASDLAAAALGKNPDALVKKIRDEFASLSIQVEELPLTIAGLEAKEQELGWECSEVSSDLSLILKAEKEAGALEGFRRFYKANWQEAGGAWDTLRDMSELDPLEFDRLRGLFEKELNQ